jgi:hypothetical protein
VYVCVGVLVISVLEFTVFCFVYVYLLFVLSVAIHGLLPPNDNSVAVGNTNNNM